MIFIYSTGQGAPSGPNVARPSESSNTFMVVAKYIGVQMADPNHVLLYSPEGRHRPHSGVVLV